MALSRRQWVAALAAPALFCAVTLLHGYLRSQHELFPWRGGGFAMFSTLERRLAVAHLFEEGEETCAISRASMALPADVRTKVTQVAGFPTSSSLQGVLDDFLGEHLSFWWVGDGTGRKVLTARDHAHAAASTEAARAAEGRNPKAPDAPVSITGVRIDVWSGKPGPHDCAQHGFEKQPCIVYERVRSASRSR